MRTRIRLDPPVYTYNINPMVERVYETLARVVTALPSPSQWSNISTHSFVTCTSRVHVYIHLADFSRKLRPALESQISRTYFHDFENMQ